jgi:TrwC relaxase
LEQTAAWARRSKGGAVREPTVWLQMAAFDHHTSRELDPQLHTTFSSSTLLGARMAPGVRF